ncbi:MAG: Ig-like domain-containing protein, partial [Cyclobacteriaceae bacterium]
PDFETGDLTYWNASAGNAAVINNNTQSGNSAGSVSNASIAQVVTLSPNTTYTITGFGKVAAGTANAFMGVSEAISNALIQNFEFTSETYSQGVITFTTGASEDNYRVWFWSGGDAYCDNFNLIEGSGGDPDPVAVNGVTVTPATLDLFVGETATLTESVAPGNATDKSVTWNTSDATVATVTNGAINAIGAGTANITVTTNDGGFQAMSEVTVTINNNLLNNPGFEFSDYSSWNIEGNSSIVGNNANGGFQAGYINGNGSINQIVSLEPNATYTASCFGKVGAAGQSVYLGVTNNTTSSFIENTLFTGTTYTQQEIIFTTGNDVNDYKIWFWNNAGGQYYVDDFSLVKNEFSPVPVNGVTLSENSLNLEEGADHSLSANVTPSNASNQNVTWSSDNASIATVNSNGYVQAIAIGTALITVTTTDGGFSDTCTVSVTSGQGGSSGIPQVGQTIWLQSSEGKYLTAITSGTTSIEATATSIGTNEEFLVVDGDGYLALKVVSTNKYVTAASATNTPLRCGASGLYNRQKFTFIEEANGTVSIKAKINGDYCGVNSASANKPVEANYQTIGSGESFRWGEVNSQSRVGSGLSAINEMETAQWSVYPNPYTGGMLKVNFGVPTSGLVRIVDLTGKEIYSRVIQDDEEITIKGISEHSSGMCLIMLKTKDKVLSKRIMMKQN